jgi:hypothetical protein
LKGKANVAIVQASAAADADGPGGIRRDYESWGGFARNGAFRRGRGEIPRALADARPAA